MHRRGPINGTTSYRCLRCGTVTNIECRETEDDHFDPVPPLADSLRAARRARIHRVCTAIGLYIMLMSAGAGLGEVLSHFPILVAVPLWFSAMALIIMTILHLHDKQVL